jgi:hypothetical protein
MLPTDQKTALDAIQAMLGCVQANGKHVTDTWLEEKQEAKLKKVRLTELGPNMLVLATDEGRKLEKSVCMSPLFAVDGVYDQNRACDAVLLRLSKTGLEVCYIEMKSDKPSGYQGQFISTHCFMHYVVQLLNELCNIEIKIVRERYIILHTDSSNVAPLGKRPGPRFKPASANTPEKPDMHCIRNGDTLRCTTIL